MESFDLIAATAFGLEAVAVRELRALGYDDAKPISTGRVLFRGGWEAVARANTWLRTVDRVLLRVAAFPASDFDQLFEGVRALPWEEWLPRNAAFPVDGRSVKSRLTSVPACQRAVKKAIAERLFAAHRVSQLPETGPSFRVEVSLLNDTAVLTLDTSGVGLHKRGYRDVIGAAALKETLAAGLVLLSVWRPDRPLVDPFCGSGTIAIEAAMIGLNLAPGSWRSFDCTEWPCMPDAAWDAADQEAQDLARDRLDYAIHAGDVDERALAQARRHAANAGVDRHIHVVRRDFADIASKADYGCIVTNPPYGQRVGESDEVRRLYERMPDVLRRLPTWSHHILTSWPNFEELVGQAATRRRKLFNAQIECTYYQFLGPRPPGAGEAAESRDDAEDERRADPGAHSQAEPGSEPDDDPARPAEALAGAPEAQHEHTGHSAAVMPAFGGLRERDLREIEDYAARLAKLARHLRRWPARGVTCYRLYERDCPDVPVIVDRYEDRVHVQELEREHSRTPAQHADWLDRVRDRTAEVLGVPPAMVYMKTKHRQRGLSQHERVSQRRETIVAHEGGLKFEVNLSDYVDTGLFLDHRETRAMVRTWSAGKRFLNLFCYTGSFSVYAAAGGAASTTSVDLSNTYLDWARRNLGLNRFTGPEHTFVKSDALEFLREHARGPRYDLAVVDPPTFSNSTMTQRDWEVQRDHVELLTGVARLMPVGGVIVFSNNFRRFKLDEARLAEHGLRVREISDKTVPADFRNRRVHRCWRLEVGGTGPGAG